MRPPQQSSGNRSPELKVKTAAYFFCLCVVLGAALLIARHNQISLRGSLIAVFDVIFVRPTIQPLSLPVDQPFVAHAGGAIRGLIYTNSREALDQSYESGFRLFEVDFDWTSDGELILTHDWTITSSQFCLAPHIFTYREFVEKRRCDGLTQMAFDDLRQWMLQHRDALVVTDTKGPNVKLFEALSNSGADVLPQLIIQIYSLSELVKARELHPRAVWLTVYKRSYPAWALRCVRGVDGIVIPASQYGRYRNDDLMRKLPWYVHSVSRSKVSQVLRDLPGIYGAFVD